MAALDSGLLCALLLESGCASHSGIPQNLRVRLGWRPSRSQAYGTYPPLPGRRRWSPRLLVTIIACEQVLFEKLRARPLGMLKTVSLDVRESRCIPPYVNVSLTRSHRLLLVGGHADVTFNTRERVPAD